MSRWCFLDERKTQALGAYAVLLHAVRPKDALVAQLYDRATKADPAAVNTLSNFGLYM